MPQPMQPAINRGRCDTPPSPLSCAILLGECIREERGKQGVCAYVAAMTELLPFSLCEQLAYRLNVPLPAPPPPPQPMPPPPPKPKGDGLQLNQLMQMMKMLDQFKK
ncbi:MAG: hypothetical protein Q4C01_06980 [Clostridia bacterium]|nr:hypothetical protein [Clostridia bacterium]